MDCCLSIRSRATSRIISAFRISPPAKKADKKAVLVFVHQFYVVTIHLLDSTGCWSCYQSHHYHLPPHNIPASFWLKFKIQHVSFLSRGLASSGPLSFCQSFPRVFLHPAESGVFSKVRVCEAQRSNESPSGAFKRQNGLAQQDGGASPRQVHVDTARILW